MAALMTTAEVAAYTGLAPRTIRIHAARLGMVGKHGHTRAYTAAQAAQLKAIHDRTLERAAARATRLEEHSDS